MIIEEGNVIEHFVNLTALAVQHGLPIQLLTPSNSPLGGICQFSIQSSKGWVIDDKIHLLSGRFVWLPLLGGQDI